MATDTLQHKRPESKTRPAPAYTKETFPVLEMTCAACAVSVESMLKSAKGVKDAGVNFANGSAWVAYDPALTTPLALRDTIRSIGYDLVLEKENAQEIQEQAQQKHYRALKQRTLWAGLLSLPIIVIGMFFMDLPYGNWIMLALATPVVLYFGRSFFVNAWKGARHGKANMDTLVAISTGIAFLFSLFNTIYPQFWHHRGLHAHVYFEAATAIIAFISLGKLLEERAKWSTSSAIKKLIGLQPKTVRIVLEHDRTQELPVSEVRPGFLVLVKPGEKIPVDGAVTEGTSYVDESMISGEPVPVAKSPGEPVYAGTINQKGSFVFSATKVGADTLLAQIIRMVQEAQGSKAPVQKLVDQIAGIFVPIVIGIALLTFTVWAFSGADNALTHALLTAVTVLVIACPCALGLATPTAIMVGVGKGAENNILIKDAESLELGYKVDAVILDKTGTITEGRPAVTEMRWKEGVDTALLRNILYTLELQSEHPLAEAVVKDLEKAGAVKLTLASFESITARGVRGQLGQDTYLVGNEKLMAEHGIRLHGPLFTRAEQLQEAAHTLVYFAGQNQVLAAIAMADGVKATSRQAVQTLQQRGIAVYMLTGDNPHTARAVAHQVGISQYRAEVLPQDKAAFVKKLQQEGKVVAMVGDGINDSHALAESDVSIAMGKGSDIAMDVAKMTLITSDLNAIPRALELSRKTVRTIRQNLFWAFIYNLIGIPVAAGLLYPVNGFLLDPMIAGAAMALSSVSVVGNSLRLKAARL